ncbi:MAG TPA: hypothetical protein PLY95_01235 [Candidatus Paceibacterota bacterium]|jgi:hypothetical protein|nr:hypothetical protein [Candidatus Paceibacterota bacterium]HPV33615.1 hypothetical protein [Candidatus Paceibacterota bacterium]HQB27065.1 hypothetical protein [Candidatus Paceibacterota bacterium]HQF41015.1 hypothetical protein [Candidatus Paceibacterota bacterium]HQI25861.1 hypothetical protein [Candidatus Paceibacterota bacterium]
MSIKNYIANVKEKPEAKRKTLLLVWSGGLTFLVALVWFVNINYVAYNRSLEEAEILAKAEAAAKTGQVEVVAQKEEGRWWELIKTNVAAVGEGFKVLTGQMDE